MEMCITGCACGIHLFIHFFYNNILLQVYPCSLCEVSSSSDKYRLFFFRQALKYTLVPLF